MKYLDCEKSILITHKKTIWRRFVRGVREYLLIAEGDRIAVCISGGKDSMLMAKCLQLLQRQWLTKFELVFLVMDPGYAPENLRQIRQNAESLGVPIIIKPSDIFVALREMESETCYMCARMRRGVLYKLAREQGCNKIALGHHFDDAIETILMSILYGGEFKTLMPKLHSANFAGMELIRPLILVKEAEIIAWGKETGMSFLQCACQAAKRERESGELASKRNEMKALVAQFRRISPNIEGNIYSSAQDVNLDTLLGYHSKCRDIPYTNFLEEYEKRGAAQ